MVVLALVEQLNFRIQIGLTIFTEEDVGLTGLGNFFCGYILFTVCYSTDASIH